MKHSWTIKPGKGFESLSLKEIKQNSIGKGEVRVSIKAVSINARDVMIALGQSPLPALEEVIPLSDGAGIVEEIGEGVTRVVPGDRVVITWNPTFQSGSHEPFMAPEPFGALRQGLLTEEITLDQMALVKLPENISYEQAACLPCAGTTAWNALFEVGKLKPGQTVLSTGTGSLSLIAMQLAKASGARFGVTSSSEEKISSAQELGADFGVNYRSSANWDLQVKDKTEGIGAHVILENAGPPSVATSIKAAAPGGRVVQIGWKGFEGPPVSVIDMALGQVSLLTIMGGSRVMLENVVAAFSVNNLKVPVHQVVDFENAPDAFAAQANGEAFGKVLISLN